MKTKDYSMVALLVFLALFIWLRDRTWMSTSDDTLPIIVSLPLFAWLATPWEWREDTLPFNKTWITVSILSFTIGIVTDFTILLAFGWTTLMWSWLSVRLNPTSLPTIKKLLILPMMAFPWVALDAQPIGWWFRLSGASVAAKLFLVGGLSVTQEGTQLVINGIPLSVEAACSGLNTLQSMLIAGSIVAYLYLGKAKDYWTNLLWLPIMAWIANTIRIITIGIAALAISPEFAMGPFHDIGGWLILFLMFCLCWLMFSVQAPTESSK